MKFSSLYLLLVWALLIGIFIAPIAAMLNVKSVADATYNAYSLLCHQYPGRSYALFPDSGKLENCTSNSTIVLTKYTSIFTMPYNGQFVYNKSDVGNIRADVCIKDGRIGYKLGVCSRDLGFYLGLAIATILHFKRRKPLPSQLFILMILPMALDGGLQFINVWESSNVIRLLTGFIAGLAVTLVILPAIDKEN